MSEDDDELWTDLQRDLLIRGNAMLHFVHDGSGGVTVRRVPPEEYMPDFKEDEESQKP